MLRQAPHDNNGKCQLLSRISSSPTKTHQAEHAQRLLAGRTQTGITAFADGLLNEVTQNLRLILAAVFLNGLSTITASFHTPILIVIQGFVFSFLYVNPLYFFFLLLTLAVFVCFFNAETTGVRRILLMTRFSIATSKFNIHHIKSRGGTIYGP